MVVKILIGEKISAPLRSTRDPGSGTRDRLITRAQRDEGVDVRGTSRGNHSGGQSQQHEHDAAAPNVAGSPSEMPNIKLRAIERDCCERQPDRDAERAYQQGLAHDRASRGGGVAPMARRTPISRVRATEEASAGTPISANSTAMPPTAPATAALIRSVAGARASRSFTEMIS